MIYYSEGSRKNPSSLLGNVVVRIDMAKPREHSQGYLSRFALHNQISTVVCDSILHHTDIDRRVDFMFDVRISMDLERAHSSRYHVDLRRALEATIRLDVTFDPEDLGGDPDEMAALAPRERLLRIVQNQTTLAWETYRLDQFTRDATVVIDCLRTLTRWDRRSVNDIIHALDKLQTIEVLYGRYLDPYWSFERRRSDEVPEGWPEGLPDTGVLLCDDAGRTLVVNEFGRLAIGPSIAERLVKQARRRASMLEGEPNPAVGKDVVSIEQGVNT